MCDNKFEMTDYLCLCVLCIFCVDHLFKSLKQRLVLAPIPTPVINTANSKPDLSPRNDDTHQPMFKRRPTLLCQLFAHTKTTSLKRINFYDLP